MEAINAPKETTVNIVIDQITDTLYLDDNGRATCAEHAGHELAASLSAHPDAQFHQTTLGTWERFTSDDIRAFGADDIYCDRCQH